VADDGREGRGCMGRATGTDWRGRQEKE